MLNTKLRRPIYTEAPQEMQLKEGKIVRVVCPVYGIPEALVYWFKTLVDCHWEKLTMKGATLDLFLVYRRSAAGLDGMFGIQVDDTVCAATRELAGEEERCSWEFLCKERIEIERKRQEYNGLKISFCDNRQKITLNQFDYIQELK